MVGFAGAVARRRAWYPCCSLTDYGCLLQLWCYKPVFYVQWSFFSIFGYMKKTFRHFLFWTFYWWLLSYLEYLWLQDFVPGWPEHKMIGRAFAGAFCYIIPHLAFAYYLVYFALVKMVQKKHSLLVNAGFILLPYFAAICSVIILAHQMVLPLIYENTVTPTQVFFEPRKFLSIMIETAFPAGLLVAIKFVEYQLAAKEREKALLKEKLTTELQLLKNQINPHFLFNTLNNIYALTRKKSDLAPDVVLKLSELLSFMLYESGSDTISVEREVNFLEDYISIQKIRYMDRLSLDFSKEIDDPGQPIAPLLLLPLVENAFKHGAGENHFDSFIRLHLRIQKGRLSFVIENSFEEPGLSSPSNAIGLSNTSRQLELLYREQALHTSRASQVFKVELVVNLNSYGKI